MATADDTLTPADEASQSVEAGARAIFDMLPEEDGDEKPAPKKAPEAEDEPADEDDSLEDERDDEDEDAPPAKEAPAPRTFRPLKHQGKEIPVASEDELYALAQKGFDYTQKTQDLSAREKAREAAEAAAKVAASDYADRVRKLDEFLSKTVDSEPEPDWAEQEALDPAGFQAKFAAYQDRKVKRERIREERQRVETGQREEANRQREEYVRQEFEQLVEHIPSLKEPKVGRALLQEMFNHGEAQYGLSAEELRSTTDHRLLRVLHDAFQFRKGQAAVDEAKAKLNGTATLSPGAPPRAEGRKAQKERADQRFARTHSIEDAARAIELMDIP
jgi:hypothetical protein